MFRNSLGGFYQAQEKCWEPPIGDPVSEHGSWSESTETMNPTLLLTQPSLIAKRHVCPRSLRLGLPSSFRRVNNSTSIGSFVCVGCICLVVAYDVGNGAKGTIIKHMPNLVLLAASKMVAGPPQDDTAEHHEPGVLSSCFLGPGFGEAGAFEVDGALQDPRCR